MSRHTPIPNLSRKLSRRAWKRIYRELRIYYREMNKASMDMLFFGTGCVLVTNGNVKHIPIEQVKFT